MQMTGRGTPLRSILKFVQQFAYHLSQLRSDTAPTGMCSLHKTISKILHPFLVKDRPGVSGNVELAQSPPSFGAISSQDLSEIFLVCQIRFVALCRIFLSQLLLSQFLGCPFLLFFLCKIPLPQIRRPKDPVYSRQCPEEVIAARQSANKSLRRSGA